jgi:hypothetical protein
MDKAARDNSAGTSSRSEDPRDERATSAAAITPETMSVIEAALQAHLGRSFRIISVSVSSGRQRSQPVWASQGRNLQHQSHNTVQRGH